MALQNSGQISLNDIRTEYGLTGSVSLGAFRGDGSQPPLPASGAISMGDFYSNIARSGKITVVQQNTSIYSYIGFGEANMVSSTPTAAFGSMTKQDIIALGNNSKRVTAMAGQSFPAYGTPRVSIFTASTVSTNGDFSTFTVCADLPTSSSTNPVYTRNKTDTSYPNSFQFYNNNPPTIAAEEQYGWSRQTTPESGMVTGGLHWNYFAPSSSHNVTTTPIVFFA